LGLGKGWILEEASSLWEYNIGLDSDAFPLMMLRPLVVFGVNISNWNEFFNLSEIRLNK
jgi:hypothetical protein